MITRPTLLLDEKKCKRNILRMVAKANENNLVFRPHFKTHQSPEVGNWFREAGVKQITVSSLTMASYFAAHGWNDITVAFPLNVLEIDTVNELASKIKLNVLVESVDTIQWLKKKLRHPVSVYIKIDIGYHRTGVDPTDFLQIDYLLQELKHPLISFKGWLGHAGHSYKSRSTNEIEGVHQSSLALMRKVKRRYQNDYPNAIASIGDTPTCSRMNQFEAMDEMRPGNFVFYDCMQVDIGSCSVDDIAVAMACPVVALHPERDEMVIYGGSVHFSKDHLIDDEGAYFGKVVSLHEQGWSEPLPKVVLRKLSQEHGIIQAPADFIKHHKVGDVMGILPVHSCLTAQEMRSYQLLSGELFSHM